ncbi:G-protein coupled receptor 183-A [Sardina pilchardus]|uniref:G-protein coupled receptor 183-A n=1 Tax=Sardina pilchardus TaxID=27697 RepID=UPI002E126803
MDKAMCIADSTNCTNATCPNLYDHRPTARVLMPLYYSIVFVVGLFGNALALHVIRPNLRKMNSTTLYSANLVVSDILFALSLPLRVLYYALGFHWPLGEVACKATALVFYINTYAGVNFMTCLSVDRFIAVVLPLRLSRFRKVQRVKWVCAFVWMLVLAQTLPLLSMPMTNAEPGDYVTCMEYPNFEQVPNLPFMLIGAVFLGYGVPVVIILICYSWLCSKLHLTAKSNHLTEKSGRNKKAIGVVLCVILVFVVCYTPYHVDLLQYMVRKLRYAPDCGELHRFQISLHFTVCLMNLNSCLDPFIYFFACKGYKKKVMKLLRRQTSMSFSSQARTSPEESSRDLDHNRVRLYSRGEHH